MNSQWLRASVASLIILSTSLVLVACPVAPPAPTFTFSLSPTAGSAVQGANSTTTATITPVDGFTGNVTFSLVGAPSGVSVTPTSLTVPGPGAATQALTIQTTTATPVGTHTLMVRATGGTVTRETSFTLTVTVAPAPAAANPIAAGMQHSLAIRRDGSLWAWGNNESGQVGDGTARVIPLPVQILTGMGFAATRSYQHTPAPASGTQ